MKITIENLIFKGIHGYTEKEKNNLQRFIVNIELEGDFHQAAAGDNLQKTVDYREIKEIARKIIETEHYDLLETIAEKIASEIIKNQDIQRATVSVSKPDIWESGVPTVTVSKHQLLPNLNLLDFDYHHFIHELWSRGGISLPILPIERRLALVAEAEKYQFIKQPETAESPLVREQLSSCNEFPVNSPFHKLADDFFELLNRKIPVDEWNLIFPTPLKFNEMSLQLYEKGSIGITPHKDGKSRINLICVFILKGVARYALVDNRSGINPQYSDTSPGNALILRGPGFMGSEYQPFHTVSDITEERIVFGLRQRTFNKKSNE